MAKRHFAFMSVSIPPPPHATPLAEWPLLLLVTAELRGPGCAGLWSEHASVSVFPQMLSRSEWDHKRGSRGSQVSAGHRIPVTAGITNKDAQLPGKHTHMHTHKFPGCCHSPSQAINDVKSRNKTTKCSVHTLLSAEVKQPVLRCHHQRVGLPFGCKALARDM